jgi:hypothetical protein
MVVSFLRQSFQFERDQCHGKIPYLLHVRLEGRGEGEVNTSLGTYEVLFGVILEVFGSSSDGDFN